MKTILFNIHDLVLLSVLVLCGLLAIGNVKNGALKNPSRHLLIAFFAMNGMIALDTLVFWGEGVRYAAFELSPWLLTVFSFATFAFGPILYWMIRCEVSPKSRPQWSLLLHLLPAIATPFYLYWVCYRFPVDIQRDLLLNLSVYSIPEAHFSVFVALKKLSPVVYGVLSLALFFQWKNKTQKLSGDIKQLWYLTLGFSLVRAWVLITHLFGIWLSTAFSDFMGIFGNYMTLALLFGLVVLSLRPSNETRQKPSEHGVVTQPDAEIDVGELSIRVQDLMEKDKPYLNPRLNLDRFAELLSVSPRHASLAINRCFNQNFQEYINGFRVEEAKRLLSSADHADMPVIEIAGLAGFNSKATFNRIFKNLESVTPTAYRQQFLSGPPQFPCHQ